MADSLGEPRRYLGAKDLKTGKGDDFGGIYETALSCAMDGFTSVASASNRIIIRYKFEISPIYDASKVLQGKYLASTSVFYINHLHKGFPGSLIGTEFLSFSASALFKSPPQWRRCDVDSFRPRFGSIFRRK